MKLVIEIPERVVHHVKINYMDISENDYAMICDAVRTGTQYEEPRPHGEWKTEPHSRIIHCSNCDAIENLNRLYVSNFCYSCGADMRKEGDKNE